MKKKLFSIALITCFLSFSVAVFAQLSVNGFTTTFTVDFDNTQAGVNNGPFAPASASPMFTASPAVGELNSAAWSYVIDGAYDTVPAVFPGSGNADFNPVSNPGTSSTGWGAWALSGDNAFAILPSGTKATAGTLTLACVNSTGSAITGLQFSYFVAAYNDQPRANKVDFLYSFDNVTYIRVPSMNFTSGLAATTTWETATKTLNLTSLNIPNGAYFYMRWYFNDVSGSGSRDEFKIDNISVSASGGSTPVATQLKITNINGGLNPSAGEPFTLTVQAQDNNNTPASLLTDKIVTLLLVNGLGTLSGTLSDTMPAGTNTLVFNNVVYSLIENDVVVGAQAPGLAQGNSDPFNVLSAATQLAFNNFPNTAISGTNLISALNTFQVHALRSDNSLDVNFTGNVTLGVYIGPGTLIGTTTRPAIAGVATFNDINFTLAGLYMLSANSGTISQGLSPAIIVLQGPSMEELVVPRFFGSKSAPSVNNCRSPFAVCFQFSHLQPSTSYNVKLGISLTSEALTSWGAGNACIDTTFSGNTIYDAFTTDSTGASVPYWVYFQPTGNATRFDAGQVHNIRVGIIESGGSFPFGPTFCTSKTLTALDVPLIQRTVTTADDGAFLHGKADSLRSGNYFLLFDNVAGTGDPVAAFQIREARPHNYHQAEVPGVIDSIWMQLPYGPKGDFAAVIPTAALNPNGIRRVEARSQQNMILAYQTDTDGIWPSGANTTAAARRDIIFLNNDDVSLISTISGTITYDNNAGTALDSVTVYLVNGNGDTIKQAVTNDNGIYSIRDVADGTYSLRFECHKKWGGSNSIDALLMLKHFVQITPLTGIKKQAGNLTSEIPPVINSTDALMAQKRFVGMISAFMVPDWVFEPVNVTIAGAGTVVKNLKGLCAGDVNGDYTPL